MTSIAVRRAFQLACAASVLVGTAACDRSPVAPGPTSASTAISDARRDATTRLVPIAGTFETRPVPPSAQPCPAGSIRTNGEGAGVISHLGRSTQSITGCFSPATLTSTGDVTLTAANGDQIHLTVTSTFAPSGPGGNAVVTSIGTITGGTGRFADATGFASIVTIFDGSAGAGTATIDGMISAAPL